MDEFIDIENNNDDSDVSIDDSFVSSSGLQTSEEFSDMVSDSDSVDNGNSMDVSNVPVFSLDENGNVLVLDNDVLSSLNTFSENTGVTLTELKQCIDDLNDNVKVLTGVVVVLGFALLMRLIIRRVFGRWSI